MRSLAYLGVLGVLIISAAQADFRPLRLDHVRIARFKYDLRTQTFRRVGSGPVQRGPDAGAVFDATSQVLGAWWLPEAATFGQPAMVMDWADLPDTAPGQTVVGRFSFAYVTNALERPMLDLTFWGGENGHDSFATRFPLAHFRLRDLPHAQDLNLPPGTPVGVILDVNLPADAPLVFVGPDLGDPNVGPPLPRPDCQPDQDPNCPYCEALYSHCSGRGLRDFGYSFDFRLPGGVPFPPGDLTGPMLGMPDPNAAFAGQCPAPGAQTLFDVFVACSPGGPCPAPGPNDPLIPDINTEYTGTFDSDLGCGQLWLRLIAAGAGSCSGDLNGDGHRDLLDLSILLQHFGGPGGPSDGDLNNDGSVDLADLAMMLDVFGTACP